MEKEREVVEDPENPETPDADEIHRLSTEDLRKALQEPSGEPAKETPKKEEPKGPEKKEPEKDPAKKTESPEKKPAEKKEPEKKEPEKKETPTPDPEKDALKAEVEKLRKKAENQDKLLAKVGTELGILRKRTPEEERAELQKIRDAFDVNPVEGDRLLSDYKQRRAAEESAGREIAATAHAEKTKGIVHQIAPEVEQAIDEIAGLLKGDGLDDKIVDNFKANPYAFDADLLISLHKRAVTARELTAARTELETARVELEKLKTENAELKKKPDSLLKKIEDAAKHRPMKADTGGAVKGDGLYVADKPVSRMSREELNRAVTASE